MEDAIRIDGQHQAAQQAGVANLITSLRFIATFDWSDFFEGVSLVEQVLQRDPAGVYSQMDFRSRDRYRHAVEELALPTGDAQLLLALKSVERARQVHVRTPDDRATHVGYHLIGPGRRAFERSVAWQPDLRHRVRRLFFAWATPIYLGSIARARRCCSPWPSVTPRGTAGAVPRWRSWHCSRSCPRASSSSSCCSD